MQDQPTTNGGEPEEFPDSSVFNVVIAYEDFETGKSAKRTYDYIAANVSEECDFAQQMWKFDVLGLPKLRKIAIADAVAADVIIVSCHGGELPAAVRAWCDGWVAQKTRAMTLVGLLDGDPEAVATVAQYLRSVASRARIEFFTPEASLTGYQGVESRVSSASPTQNTRTTSLFTGAARTPQAPSTYDAGL